MQATWKAVIPLGPTGWSKDGKAPVCCGARWHPEAAEHAGRWSFPFQLLAQLALEVALLARQAGLPAKLAFGQERGNRGRDVRERKASDGAGLADGVFNHGGDLLGCLNFFRE
ncbi:hypothetical protein G6F24_018282 [Rhizopus arrhizus]|nr:hypothetical protein G6F24_018282 [Rhizopus arrhizus]